MFNRREDRRAEILQICGSILTSRPRRGQNLPRDFLLRRLTNLNACVVVREPDPPANPAPSRFSSASRRKPADGAIRVRAFASKFSACRS